jgi:hypothetical protein
MPRFTAEVDVSSSDIVDLIVDDPELIESALASLIDMASQKPRRARHAGAAANVARYSATLEALRSDAYGTSAHVNEDDIAVDALADTAQRLRRETATTALIRRRVIHTPALPPVEPT